MRFVVLNFLRLGQQEAVVLGVVDRALDVVARESPDRVHRWPPAQRDDLYAFVIQIAHRNQRAEIAWRRAIVSETGVAHIGDVFAGQLTAELASPFSKDCHSHGDLSQFRSASRSSTQSAQPEQLGPDAFARHLPLWRALRYSASSATRIEPDRIVARNGVPRRTHTGRPSVFSALRPPSRMRDGTTVGDRRATPALAWSVRNSSSNRPGRQRWQR